MAAAEAEGPRHLTGQKVHTTSSDQTRPSASRMMSWRTSKKACHSPSTSCRTCRASCPALTRTTRRLRLRQLRFSTATEAQTLLPGMCPRGPLLGTCPPGPLPETFLQGVLLRIWPPLMTYRWMDWQTTWPHKAWNRKPKLHCRLLRTLTRISSTKLRWTRCAQSHLQLRPLAVRFVTEVFYSVCSCLHMCVHDLWGRRERLCVWFEWLCVLYGRVCVCVDYRPAIFFILCCCLHPS